jgi:hypothetical protein
VSFEIFFTRLPIRRRRSWPPLLKTNLLYWTYLESIDFFILFIHNANTMKNYFIALLVIVLIILGVYWYMNRPMTNGTEMGSEEIVIVLAEQNDSGESGTATFTQVDGKAVITLSMDGAPEDVVQPAHIHIGACPDVGGIQYPLLSPVNGASVTTLDVSVDQIFSELPLAINVHKSQPEASVYVSCGDLAR